MGACKLDNPRGIHSIVTTVRCGEALISIRDEHATAHNANTSRARPVTNATQRQPAHGDGRMMYGVRTVSFINTLFGFEQRLPRQTNRRVFEIYHKTNNRAHSPPLCLSLSLFLADVLEEVGEA